MQRAIDNFKILGGNKDCPEQKVDPLECELMRTVMDETYEYDIKTRNDGWSSFLDLIFGLAMVLGLEGKGELDRELSKIAQIRPLIERLEEVKNIPIVDKAMEIIQMPG